MDKRSVILIFFLVIAILGISGFSYINYKSNQPTNATNQPNLQQPNNLTTLPPGTPPGTPPTISTTSSGTTPPGTTPPGTTSSGTTPPGTPPSGTQPKQEVVSEDKTDYEEKICKTENKLPCKPNFSSVLIKDTILNKEVNCCVANDTRNDTQVINNFMLACKQAVIDIKEKNQMDAFTYLKNILVSNSKNEYNEKFLNELIKVIVLKQKKIFVFNTTNALDYFLSDKIGLIIQRTLSDILVNKNTLIQTNYSNLRNKLIELKEKNPANAGLSINDWEILTFDSYNSKIDYLSKDLQNTTFLKEYIKMRNLSLEALNNELKKNNKPSPFIISPLSKLTTNIPVIQEVSVNPTATTETPLVEKFASVISSLPTTNILIEQIVVEFCFEYINMVLEKVGKETLKLSDKELSDCINKLFIEGINYFNQKEGSDYIDFRLCSFVNGSYENGSCSYKDKDACDNSYNWDDLKGSNLTNQIYTEFKDNKCILSNPIYKRICDDQNLKYNSTKQACEVTTEFCTQKSLKPIDNNSEKDCELPFNSDMFTLLFTNRLIDSVNNSFNSDQYKNCESSDFNSSNIPKEVDTVLNNSLKLQSPYNIPAIVYKMNPKKACIKNVPCSEEYELKDNLCVEKCKPGYKSDGNKCFKLYPGFDVETFGDVDPLTGTGNTTAETTNVSSENTVDPLTGTGLTTSGGMSYDVLSEQHGFTPTQEVKSEMTLLPNKIVKKVVSNKPSVITYCGPDKIKENLLCYDKCRDQFKSDGALLCYKQYPDFENNGQGHTITSVTKKITLNTGKPLSFCDPDKSKENLLCYDKCKDGFKSDGAVLCYKQYPEFESNGQGHTITSITKKITTNTGKPLSYCDPDKSKENLLCYDKCRDGFKSDGAVLCYKQYPEFENNGQGHTITSITKKITTNTGKPLSFCDPDKSKENLLCYDKCRDGFSSDGAVLCYKNPPPNWPGTTSLTHLQHKTIYSGPGKPLTTCNADQDKDGALCYPKCKPGFSGAGPVCWGNCPANTVDVGALCRNNCDAGYKDVAGVCWEIPPPGTVDVGALIRNGCDAGYNDVAGVCWEITPPGAVDVGALIRDGCRAGYKDVAGVCWGSCPAGWNDDGAICRENMRWDSCSWRGAYGECVGGLVGGTLRAKDSYVPTTRPRKSYVPATRPKKSYVPATNAKPSYGRGAGEPLKCAPGLEQRGALCYEDCTKNNANGIEYERRGDNIDFCSTKCPPGFKNIGIGGCEKEMYNRGVGQPMKCQPGQKQIGALCYEPCPPGTTMNTEGLCSQDCPPGSKDFGVGCTREAYNRGIGQPMKCQPGQKQISALCYEPCPPGTTMNTEGLCAQDCPPGSKDFGVGCTREAYNRGIGQPMKCQPGQKQIVGLCYEPCPPGTSMDTEGLCAQNCPPGSKDFGVGCTREAYNRGIGKPMTCRPNEVQKGALCYAACPPGLTLKEDGNCRQDCPPGSKDTGDACERESYDKKTSVLPFTSYIRDRVAPYIVK